MPREHYIKQGGKLLFRRLLYFEWNSLVSTEREYLKALREEAGEAETLFSNSGQALQERTAVAGFLRVLGIDFQENEIIKRGPEPIDVWFRDARFQVTEIIDEGRHRNREIRARAGHFREAASLGDLIERGTISSQPMAPSELVDHVAKRCREKEDRYGGNCGGVDLLVYVNLKGRYVYPLQPFPLVSEKTNLCWRSVSVVMEHFAIVLWVAPDAPSFLVQRVGQPSPWKHGPESVFPKLIP